jgi:carotenoid cleavage dioxygenase-like enzyme
MVNMPNTAVLTGAFRPMRFEATVEYAIFDTDDITAGPVCRIEIPFLLGFTPHGHWMDFR